MVEGKIGERAPPFAYVAAGILFLTLVLGGATHGDAITSLVARLLCIGLFGYCLWTLPRDKPSAAVIVGLVVVGLIALVTLAQLVPLPPSIWKTLPGRAFLVANFQAMGAPLTQLPLSLAPDSTWNLLPGLAVPAAMFLAAGRSNGPGRRLLAAALLAAALASLCLAALQLTGGPDSPLRIYAITNNNSGVGFFANRNHQAALLVAAIPLTVYWAMRVAKRSGVSGITSAALALGVILLWVVGLGITLSRAGVLLGAAALIGGLAMVMRTKAYPGRPILFISLLGTVVLGGGLIFLFAFSALSGRFAAPLSAENRLETAPTIIRTAEAFSPAGAGFGSFVPAYQMFEPPAAISDQYLNHAHDDYLELWIEAGWTGAALAGILLVWVFWRVGAAWLTQAPEADLARAASLIVLAVLLHSLVDYPLRTAAIAAVFGVSCGLMTPVKPSPTKSRHSR